MDAFWKDTGQPETMEPLTCRRALADFPVANRPLRELQQEQLRRAGWTLTDAPTASPLFHVRGDAWLSLAMLRVAFRAAAETPIAIADPAGESLAWSGISAAPDPKARILPLDSESFPLVYPWDLLRLHEIVIAAMHWQPVEGRVHPAAHVEGRLYLGPRSVVKAGVVIEGPAVIGADCVIGPNCYLRGPVSIGDRCHVGQAVELKNSILLPDTNVGHLSYCGDSILGSGVNFGAGTITANFRHDGKTHRSLVGGRLLDTGRRKLGAIVGDNVHTGIHTSLYPGRKLWPDTSTRPGAVVDRDLQ